MAILVSPQLIEGSHQVKVEDLRGPHSYLRLIGPNLLDEHGMVVAELVEDKDVGGRYFWRIPSDKLLYQELEIHGQGRP